MEHTTVTYYNIMIIINNLKIGEDRLGGNKKKMS